MPQAFLGIAFNFGIVIAFAAVQGEVPAAAWVLWLANLFMVLAYDTEYAMVDRDDDLKIGIQQTQLGQERLILELFGLKDAEAFANGVLFHGTGLKDTAMTTDRLVGHRDHTYYMVTALNQGAETLNSEVGSAHIHDS